MNLTCTCSKGKDWNSCHSMLLCLRYTFWHEEIMVPSINIFMVPCFHRWPVQQLRMRRWCSASLASNYTIQYGAMNRSEAGNSNFRLKFQPTEHNAEKNIGEKIITRSRLYLWYHVSIYLSCIFKPTRTLPNALRSSKSWQNRSTTSLRVMDCYPRPPAPPSAPRTAPWSSYTLHL